MVTIINNPAENESTGFGFIAAIVLVIVIALVLLFIYGIPLIGKNSGENNIDVNVKIPALEGNTPN